MARLSWTTRGIRHAPFRKRSLRAAAAADGHDREADTEDEAHLTGGHRARRGGAATFFGLLLLTGSRRVGVVLFVLATGVALLGRALIGELLFLAGHRTARRGIGRLACVILGRRAAVAARRDRVGIAGIARLG